MLIWIAASALSLSGARPFTAQAAHAAQSDGLAKLERTGSPAAPSSAPAGPYGLIWLDVDPGPAEISLDGEFLDAGVWLISVSPGEHDVRIRKTGFHGYAGRISVPAGGSVHVDVHLQPGAAGDS